MRDKNILFFEEDLDAQLRARQQSVSPAVDRIPKERFLVSTDQEIVDHVVAGLSVEQIVLHEEKMTMDQNETQVDVSHDRMRVFRQGRTGPFYIPGTRVDIDIPFTGEEWIFRYRTNPWSTVFPRADVQGGRLRLTITQPHDADPNTFKTVYEREIALVREYLERARNQIVGYNDSLPNLVQQAMHHRRERLGRHGNIAALLDIPLATKPGAPSIEPVKVEIRRPAPLPVPPKSGLKPEPGISDQSFEHILRLIRHQGRTFERTPSTYAVHGEEDLRNIILAHLNGHFQGDAVGEVFRGAGKTDICIEQNNRAAFVAECKLWTGPSSVTGALDQLMGYLTWRDSKAALVIFNVKNKDFTKILKAMPDTLRVHPLFLRELPCTEAGEWQIQTRSAEDAGRRVTVQAFVFNLYHNLQTPNG
ncbi:MAG: hypothetical protein OXQ89_16675 [Rhodospirillaceae bacterium]|nr:hypothetical protein [Rhodospirillaceae bacterium]